MHWLLCLFRVPISIRLCSALSSLSLSSDRFNINRFMYWMATFSLISHINVEVHNYNGALMNVSRIKLRKCAHHIQSTHIQIQTKWKKKWFARFCVISVKLIAWIPLKIAIFHFFVPCTELQIKFIRLFEFVSFYSFRLKNVQRSKTKWPKKMATNIQVNCITQYIYVCMCAGKWRSNAIRSF